MAKMEGDSVILRQGNERESLSYGSNDFDFLTELFANNFVNIHVFKMLA